MLTYPADMDRVVLRAKRKELHMKLSPAMERMLRASWNVPPAVYPDGSTWDRGILVSGRQWRTALALHERGLVTLQPVGAGRGWVKARVAL